MAEKIGQAAGKTKFAIDSVMGSLGPPVGMLDLLVMPALGIHVLVLALIVIGVQFNVTAGGETCLKELNDHTDGKNSNLELRMALVSTLFVFLFECAKRKRARMNQTEGMLRVRLLGQGVQGPLTKPTKPKKVPPLLALFKPEGNDMATGVYMVLTAVLLLISLSTSFLTLKHLTDAPKATITGSICNHVDNIDLQQLVTIGYVALGTLVAAIVAQVFFFLGDASGYSLKIDVGFTNLRDGAIVRLLISFAIYVISTMIVLDNLDVDTQCLKAKPMVSSTLAIMIFSLTSIVWSYIGADATEQKKDGDYQVAPLAATRVIAGVLIVLTLFNHVAYKGATKASLGCPTASTTDIDWDGHYDLFMAALVGLGLELFLQFGLALTNMTGYKGTLGRGGDTSTNARGQSMGGLGLHATDRLTSDKQKRSGGIQFV
jgi:hypothetical protein